MNWAKKFSIKKQNGQDQLMALSKSSWPHIGCMMGATRKVRTRNDLLRKVLVMKIGLRVALTAKFRVNRI